MTRYERNIFIHLAMLFTTAIFASDAYLPSLPAMMHALHTNHHAARLTIGYYFLGFALSPLLLGPLSDRFGRRKVLLSGLTIGVCGSTLCVLANHITILIIGRFVQGAGMASGYSISRAVVGDSFKGKMLARVSSHMGMLMSLVPAIAPTIGGYVESFFGWRANFILLLVLIAAVFLSVFKFLPETNLHLKPHAAHLKHMLLNYGGLLINRRFILYPICSCFTFGAYMIFMTFSPFLFQTLLGFSPIQYGWLVFLISSGIFLGSFANSFLVKRHSPTKLMLFGATVMSLCCLFMLITGLLGWLNTSLILIPMLIFLWGTRFIFSNGFAQSIRYVGHQKGIAAALFSAMQTGGSALAASVASMLDLHTNNQVPMAAMVSTLSITTLFLVYLFMPRTDSSYPNSDIEKQKN